MNLHEETQTALRQGEPLSAAAQAHLQTCAECRTYAAMVQRLQTELFVPSKSPTEAHLQQQIRALQAQANRRRPALHLRGFVRGLAPALLLLALLFGGWQLLRSWRFAPATATPLSPTLLPNADRVPPRLAPDACPTDLPPLGAQVSNEAFTLHLYLICDPQFSRDASDPSVYSLVNVLGFQVGYTYIGQNLPVRISEGWGIAPFYAQRNTLQGEQGQHFDAANRFGLFLPPEQFYDFTQPQIWTLDLMYQVQADTGEQARAVLHFVLSPTPEGFLIEDVQVRMLDEAEWAGLLSRTAQPWPTAESLTPALSRLQTLTQAWQNPLLDSPGWLHLREHGINQYPLPNGSGLPNEYEVETWYELGEGRLVLRAVQQTRGADGTLLQESVYQDGTWYDRTYGRATQEDSLRIDNLDLDFVSLAAQAWQRGLPITHDPAHAQGEWQGELFQLQLDGLQFSALFDPQTGQLLRYQVLGQTAAGEIDQQTVILTQERLQQPPADVLQRLEAPQLPYQPPTPPELTCDEQHICRRLSPLPEGFDPSRTSLCLNSMPGDSLDMPTFWYGDFYAGDVLLGRLDLGWLAGGMAELSPDGRAVAFVHIQKTPEQTLSRLRWAELTDLSAVQQPLPQLNLVSSPSWSPQGRRLAFAACDAESCAVYRYDALSQDLLVLAPGQSGNGATLWSPDGRWIAFVTTSQQWVVADAETGQQLAQGDYADRQTITFADWSFEFPLRSFAFSSCPAQ